jgi:hypothetical protein
MGGKIQETAVDLDLEHVQRRAVAGLEQEVENEALLRRRVVVQKDGRAAAAAERADAVKARRPRPPSSVSA